MTKILYIIPPYFYHKENSITDTLPTFTIPYGILSIDSYIKHNIKNTESQLFDFNVEIKNHGCYNINLLKNKLEIYKPDVVAISALFDTSYNYLNIISSVVKEYSNSTLVVVGGGLPTNLYKKILNDFQNIDVICYGEGEIPMRELLNSNTEHKSLISRKSLKEGKVPINTFVHNLDDIPEFDYNIINLSDYNGRSLDKVFSNNIEKVEMSIHTSRGCPFNCVFCANGKLHGKKVRYMSIDRVIKEVKNMIKNHNLTTLIIEDDNFLLNKKRAKEILKKLIQFNIKLEFPNGLAVYSIDEEIGELLKKAGTNLIALAVESGSDHVLKNIIDKPHIVNMIKPAVNILRKNNIRIKAFIVIGLPGETDEHRLETLNMLKNIGFDWVHVAIAIPVVGSRLYDICVENNYLLSNNMENHIISKANIKTHTVDPEKIEKYVYLMNLDINFVNNYNIKNRNYKIAKLFFEDIIKKYPNHAFAYYFFAKICEYLNEPKYIITKNYNKFKEIIERNKEWKEYANQFNLR